ncbi:MAG: hypothetical protein H0X47_17685 [Nitrospirales bacterium]|nr:hypothetical protein [Nitrospirales bacterium]
MVQLPGKANKLFETGAVGDRFNTNQNAFPQPSWRTTRVQGVRPREAMRGSRLRMSMGLLWLLFG